MIDLARVMKLFRELYPCPLDFIQSEGNDYWLAHRVEYVDRADNVTGYDTVRGIHLGHNLNQVWDSLWSEKSYRKWQDIHCSEIPF